MPRLLKIEHVDGNGDKTDFFINPDQIISLRAEGSRTTRIKMSNEDYYYVNRPIDEAVSYIHSY